MPVNLSVILRQDTTRCGGRGACPSREPKLIGRATRTLPSGTFLAVFGREMLRAILREILFSGRRSPRRAPMRRRVLNVGGGSKTTPIPPYYGDWEHVLLDVDPRGRPDIVCDARNLQFLQGGQFDAVYCSHNLEHYHRHDGAKVLRGFHHVLKADGFAEIKVPDLESVIQRIV